MKNINILFLSEKRKISSKNSLLGKKSETPPPSRNQSKLLDNLRRKELSLNFSASQSTIFLMCLYCLFQSLWPTSQIHTSSELGVMLSTDWDESSTEINLTDSIATQEIQARKQRWCAFLSLVVLVPHRIPDTSYGYLKSQAIRSFTKIYWARSQGNNRKNSWTSDKCAVIDMEKQKVTLSPKYLCTERS